MTGTETPSRRLTRRGWWFVAIGVGAGAAAFALRERDLLMVAGVALGAVLLAWVLTGRGKPGVQADHRVRPRRLQQGEDGALLVRFSAPDRATHALEVEQPAAAGLFPATSGVIGPIQQGDAAELRVPFRAGRRGQYVITSPVLTVRDPFGLVRVRTPLSAGDEVLVLPTVLPLVGLPRGLTGRGSATGASSTTGGGDPDAGVRGYRVGDDIRTVHWRASARLEEDLVVRVSGASSLGSTLLLLDHRVSAYSRDGLEVAVTLAASIGHHLHEEDVDLAVADHTGRELVAGHDVDSDLLLTLAAAGSTQEAFHPSVTGRPDAVIAIVGALTAAEVSALAPLRRRGASAIALVVGELAVSQGDGSPSEHDSVAGALRGSGWRVVAVEVGEAEAADGGTYLAQVWREAAGARTRVTR